MTSVKKQRTPRSKITYVEVDRDIGDMENEMLKMRKDMTQMITRMRELRRKYRKCVQFKGEGNKRDTSESNDVNTKVSISTELSNFIGKDEDIEVSCGEIILAFNKYIKTNNLQDSKNPLNIKPNKSLKQILKLGKGDKLTFHNILTYLQKHHFQTDC
jgi:chromatin remodeling complex protein RSC6